MLGRGWFGLGMRLITWISGVRIRIGFERGCLKIPYKKTRIRIFRIRDERKLGGVNEKDGASMKKM